MHSHSREGMEALLLHLTTLQSHSLSLTTRPSRNLTIMAIPSMETISRGITTTATTHSQEENNLLLYPTKKRGQPTSFLFAVYFSSSHLLVFLSSCHHYLDDYSDWHPHVKFRTHSPVLSTYHCQSKYTFHYSLFTIH